MEVRKLVKSLQRYMIFPSTDYQGLQCQIVAAKANVSKAGEKIFKKRVVNPAALGMILHR